MSKDASADPPARFNHADAATGEFREVLEETVATQYESGQGRVNWHYLPASNEVIWYSERDNWGQLYLYDLGSGKLKNKITNGEGPVMQIARLDEKSRAIWYGANGAKKDRIRTSCIFIGLVSMAKRRSR